MPSPKRGLPGTRPEAWREKVPAMVTVIRWSGEEKDLPYMRGMLGSRLRGTEGPADRDDAWSLLVVRRPSQEEPERVPPGYIVVCRAAGIHWWHPDNFLTRYERTS